MLNCDGALCDCDNRLTGYVRDRITLYLRPMPTISSIGSIDGRRRRIFIVLRSKSLMDVPRLFHAFLSINILSYVIRDFWWSLSNGSAPSPLACSHSLQRFADSFPMIADNCECDFGSRRFWWIRPCCNCSNLSISRRCWMTRRPWRRRSSCRIPSFFVRILFKAEPEWIRPWTSRLDRRRRNMATAAVEWSPLPVDLNVVVVPVSDDGVGLLSCLVIPSGLPRVAGFCCPWWRWSQPAKCALRGSFSQSSSPAAATTQRKLLSWRQHARCLNFSHTFDMEFICTQPQYDVKQTFCAGIFVD